MLVIASITILVELRSQNAPSEDDVNSSSGKSNRATRGHLDQNGLEVSSVGLGKIPDIRRSETVDPYELYEQYEIQDVFSPGAPPHSPRYFKLHFNGENELMKLSYREGTYRSVDRSRQVIPRMEELFGMKILKLGVAGFTMEDKDRMTDFLQGIPFSGWYDNKEFEVTPVVFEKVNDKQISAEMAKDLVGRKLNGFLIRYTNGPRSSLVNTDLLDYRPEEKIRWFWSLQAFPSEMVELSEKWKNDVGFSEQFDEPTPEAFAKRKIIRTRWIDAADIKVFTDDRGGGYEVGD